MKETVAMKAGNPAFSAKNGIKLVGSMKMRPIATKENRIKA